MLSLSVTSGGRAGLGFPVCQGQKLAACLPLPPGHHAQCQPRPQGAVCCSTACGANSAAPCSALQLSSLSVASLFCFCLLSLPCAFLATSTHVFHFGRDVHASLEVGQELWLRLCLCSLFSHGQCQRWTGWHSGGCGDSSSSRIPYLKPGRFTSGWGRAGDAPSLPGCAWHRYSHACGKSEQWA